MFKNLRSARPAVAVLLVLAVVAVACGEQEASLPIEPAGPRPATSTTTTEASPEVVVEVPTATPPTSEAEAVLVAVEAPPATTAPGPDVGVTTQAEAEEGFVVMNTWVDDPTAATLAPTTTAAPVTTEAVTTTTAEVVPVSTIVVVPETTTTVAPPTTTTEAVATTTTTSTTVVSTTSTSVVDAPPIPREGDEGVPEVNDERRRPVEVDLSWFPERRNVISWEEWNRVDEENTPWWARLDVESTCPPRIWWSYPLTIQVGTVLANAPRGADCFSSEVPQSYVVTRIYREPVCETDSQRNCTSAADAYVVEGFDRWFIVLCGYTFEGRGSDWGIGYDAGAVRMDDGRFRVLTNSLSSPRECNR